MSTRSIDRYIRSGKLRSKKEGKIVYIHTDDVKNLLGTETKQEIILQTKSSQKNKNDLKETSLTKNDWENNFVRFYDDLKSEIKQKDEEIKKLNQEIGRMQEVVKNSISLLEYKKSHFLLEESKHSLSAELDQVKKELSQKTQEAKDERILNYIMIAVTCVIFILMILLWVMKI